MLQGNISKDEVLANPDAVLDVLEFQSNIMKKETQQSSAPAANTGTPESPLPAEREITLSNAFHSTMLSSRL